MDFLIHVLFQEGMRPNLKEVQAIKKWQSLVTTKGVKSFPELVNFYKKFITFFPTLAKSLMDLFKKELSFEW